MAITRWLKWNGVYDLAGICNKPLISLDSKTEQIKAVKERLYLLGFDCGALDNMPNEETKKALMTFNGYWNHPTFRKWVPTEHNTSEMPPYPLDPASPYYDGMTIDCLKKMDDEWWASDASVPLAPIISGSLQVSRNRRERTAEFGLTINTVTQSLAVKIVSTPKSIVPFSEYAAIKLKITGFENVRNLLIRIYRHFDPKQDEVTIPGDKMIYQEILDYKAIQALTDKGPESNTGEHHKAKAYIMRQEVGGGMSGFLRRFLGLAYDRLHAPYKIRVWVSTVDNYFDKYAFKPTGEMPSSRKKTPKEESENLHYLDALKRKEVGRKRKLSLDENASIPAVTFMNEPDVDHINGVHDKSNKARKDKSEKEIKKNWEDLADINAALYQRKLWTSEDKHKINLIEESCAEHNARFLLDNILQDEPLPDFFVRNPVKTYKDLRKRLDVEGNNFKYHELQWVFENVERHINNIKRRLCCGQWSHIEKSIKDDVISFVDNNDSGILREMGNLKRDKYPYDKSIHFLECFMSFVSYITFKAVTRAELDFYKAFDLQETPQRLQIDAPVPDASPESIDYVRDRRNQIDGCRSTAPSEYGFYSKHPFSKLSNCREAFEIPIKGKGVEQTDGYLKMKAEILKKNNDRNDIGKAILLPSYNELDAYFFAKIRAVPLFMVGMLDMQYLNADGIRQLPLGFFEHDLFHVETGSSGAQQWDTLYKRLCEVIDKSKTTSNLLTEEQVYEGWQKNIDQLVKFVETFTDDKKKVLEFFLFWLLHEPRTGQGIVWVEWVQSKGFSREEASTMIRLPSPAMPEKTLMIKRLTSGPKNHSIVLQSIRREDSIDFFGKETHSLIKLLDWVPSNLGTELLRINDLS